jgi:hypothetical protein
LTVTEILAANVADMSDKTVVHNGYNASKTLNAISSPPASLTANGEIALVTGAKTIDLTALVGSNNLAVSGTGLRVQVVKLRNKSTNANSMTFAKGASNGYDGLGASFSITLAPGGEATIYLNDAGGDIGATNKNIDVSGTGVQVIEWQCVLG